MHKIWIIIQREYLTRVRNKRFLLVTFLMPLLIIGLIFGSAFLMTKGVENRKIAVIDPNGYIKSSLKNTDQIEFAFPTNVDTSNYTSMGCTDRLILPNFDIGKRAG